MDIGQTKNISLITKEYILFKGHRMYILMFMVVWMHKLKNLYI